MSGLTKLGFVLVLVFSLSLFGLGAAELLYHLHCRRRRCPRPASDPEVGCPSDGPSAVELILHVLCFKHHRSRVEPACAAPVTHAVSPPKPPVEVEAEAEEEECDLARWLAMCLGPSRALYTINEEEERDDEEETPFATPCASLRFFTQSPSPPRKAAEAGDDAGGLSPAVAVSVARGEICGLPYEIYEN